MSLMTAFIHDGHHAMGPRYEPAAGKGVGGGVERVLLGGAGAAGGVVAINDEKSQEFKTRSNQAGEWLS